MEAGCVSESSPNSAAISSIRSTVFSGRPCCVGGLVTLMVVSANQSVGSISSPLSLVPRIAIANQGSS
jgi:hypothetical protein